MHDAEHLLDAALQQVQVAASQLKEQHSTEARMWQTRAQELESAYGRLQNQVHGLEKANQRLHIALDEKVSELENLQSMNANLTRALQEKEQAINRYTSLNQSLKGLLNHTQDDAPTESRRNDYSARQHPITDQSGYDYPTRVPLANDSARVPELRPQSAYSRQFTGAPPPRSPIRAEPELHESPPRPSSKSSMFIRAAKQELTYSDFNQMISEINQYNRKQQSREATIENVKRLLCPSHRGLFDQFLPMISGA
jgi:hypothetical protein